MNENSHMLLQLIIFISVSILIKYPVLFLFFLSFHAKEQVLSFISV